jgi:iron complex outermembrane receptor protein
MSLRNSSGAVIALASLCGAPLVHADAPSEADSKPIDTVLVTASPLSHNADDIATIVNTVNRQQILQSGGANLADALANEPGVTGTSFASGASRPVIRGFDANRVRVLENGIGSFDVSDVGPDHGVPIDPLSTEKIEVVRGAATLRYGSQAIGGVVNAINNRVPSELPDKPFAAELTGSYGTNADSRQGSAMFDARAGQFAIHADGFDRRADDYDIPDGTMGNSYFKGDGYSLGGSYFFGDSHVGVGGVHYDSQYGIPGEDTFIDMKQTKEMLRSSFAIGAGAFQTLTVEGGYADYEHSEIDPATGEALATFKDNEWDARAEGLFGKVGPFSGLAVGVQAQNRNFSALGEGNNYLNPTATETGAGFLFAEAPLIGSLRLQTGARFEHVKVEGTPATDVLTSRTFTPISGSAGLVFDATPIVRLGVTLSSAARAPAQTELFARGPHDGPATFETGDPTLGLERATSLEGTMRVRLDKVRVDASVWGAKFSNYIFGELTGRTCDDDGNCVVGNANELKELNYTQVDAKFYGAEAKTTVSVYENSAGKLQAELLADYVRAKVDNGGNIPRIPPYHVGAGLHWEGVQLDGGFMFRYAGRQDNIATAETVTAGFTSLDAHFGWRPIRSRPGFELALVGHNLTDTVQHNSVALNKDEVILPGRDVRLVVRAAF